MNDEPPEPRPRVIVGTREAGVVGEGVLENGGAERWVALAEHVLDDAGLGRTPIELTVHFVDEPEMAELNRDHLGGDGPTDVLAFPVDDPSEVPEGLPVLGPERLRLHHAPCLRAGEGDEVHTLRG